jgi:glycosyltransferase involved in cell wall biosynthesis
MNELEATSMKIALVAEHASIDFGGEAALPCHYFRELLKLDIDVCLIVHSRSREFLKKTFPHEQHRIHYVEDTALHRCLHQLHLKLPHRLSYFTCGILLRQLTQRKQIQILKRLIREKKVHLVHQVIPVSPKEPSAIFGLGVPVVIGPMNGGMSFPPAFATHDGIITRAFTSAGRSLSRFAHWILPGKLRADLLLVANARTRMALPSGTKGSIIEMVENGIDADVWQSANVLSQPSVDGPRFVFVGRLVDWKGVDILLDAFALASRNICMRLHIVGDGPERNMLEAKSAELLPLMKGTIHFHGWLSQAEVAKILHESTAMALPSLYECGGAVVLEAMASELPVIATKWGGPMDYLNEECGYLIEPTSRSAMIEGFAETMMALAVSTNNAASKGKASRAKVTEYSWSLKTARVVEFYKRLIQDA